MRTRLRSIIRQIHLYLGLTLGAFFSFLGITGGVLVFEHEIDEWLNPALLISAEHTARPDLDSLLTAASLYNPSFQAQRVEVPRNNRGVYLLRGTHNVEGESKPLTLYVDPTTLTATGSRVWGEYPLSFIYRLHYTLLMGKQGSAIVGTAGILLLVMLVSGLFLWWPKVKQGKSKLVKWKQAIAIKWKAKPVRVIWDLHRSLGFFSSIFLVVVTFSGVYMIFPNYLKPVINIISPVTPTPAARSQPLAGAPKITPEQALQIADAKFPDAKLKRLYLPKGEEDAYRVIKRSDSATIKSLGDFQLWIDQYSGNILATRTPDKLTAGDYITALQFPLHNGEAFGLSGRVIVLLTSFMPAILFISGILIWNAKRVKTRTKSSIPSIALSRTPLALVKKYLIN